ncbi:hypothetical protein Q1695_003646 [Nippostrongylus brasiliensis]|nr:hypothetical protein Q1695_003646 [Nippostrongylus brasiliensis]
MATISKFAVGTGICAAGVCILLKVLAYWCRISAKEGEANTSLENSEHVSTARKRPRYRSRLITIPRRSIGAVLGRGGANVRAIEKETKTFIKVLHFVRNGRRMDTFTKTAPSECNDEVWAISGNGGRSNENNPAFVEIRGQSEDDIQRAIMDINDCVEYSNSPMTTRIVEVPSHLIGCVIGRDGSAVKELRQLCNVRIQIDRNSFSSVSEVSITGREDRIAQASARIAQQIRRLHFKKPFEENNVEAQLLELLRLQEQLEEEW